MPRNDSALASPIKPVSSTRHISSAEIKLTADDLAFNKIFVGGLHYDTRDGKISTAEFY